jgi:hypothetical protein
MRDSHFNGNPYQINPSRIAIGGVSAGAVVALHAGMVTPSDEVSAAYLSSVQNNGGWNGNTNDIEVSSDVVAVVSYSGAILDSEMIDWNDPAFIAFHDNEDPVVPFEAGFYSPDGETDLVQLEGTSSMAERGEMTGSYFEFVVNEGDEHLGYLGGDLTSQTTEDETGQFLYDIFCNDVLSTGNPYIKEEVATTLYPNPVRHTFMIESAEPIADVKIVNGVGSEVALFSASDEYRIDDFDKGLYYVVITFQDDKRKLVKKLIKQ